MEAWEAVDKNWRTGIEYIFGQLKAVLEKEGVTSLGKSESILILTFTRAWNMCQ
jgi:molecular chaperone GrpE (heat shock protein)